MITATVRVKKNALPGLTAALRRELAKAGTDGAAVIERRAKENVVAMGAVDTGALLNSGQSQQTGPLEWRISFPVEYALYVHEGHATRGGSFVPGRPFLSNAVDQSRADIRTLQVEAVRRATS